MLQRFNSCINVQAQYTRQQAINLVENTILQTDIGSVDVYASLTSRTSSQPIDVFNNETITCTYANNWVFFVDDKPFANWMHDCRYIFVDASTGNYNIVNDDMFPVDLYTNFELINQITRPVVAGLPDYSVVPEDDPTENDAYKYAVLISTWDNQRYWNNISVIYNTLIQKYGYQKENIYVHYYDGTSSFGSDLDGPPSSNDIDADASKSQVQSRFAQLSNSLDHGSQLFVFMCGWSIQAEQIGLIDDPLYPTFLVPYTSAELASDLEDIACSQMNFLLSFNYSGSFKDELSDFTTYNVECPNRSINTSTSATKESYNEIHITNNKYDEYVFYWSAAARGAYPVTDEPWNESVPVGQFNIETYFPNMNHPLDESADVNGDGYIQMEEAFDYADFYDTWSVDNCYFPYTPGLEEDPEEVIEIPCQDPIMTLWGMAGVIKTTNTFDGHYIVGKKVTINNNGIVNIGNNSEFYFADNYSKIHSYGVLNIGTGCDFEGLDNVSWKGSVRVHNDCVFTIGSNTEFDNMRVEFAGYPYLSYMLFDHIKFNNSQVNGHIVSADVNDCELTNSTLEVYQCDDFSMDDCVFSYSSAYISGNNFTTTQSQAIINECNFSSNSTGTAVFMWDLPKYYFYNNSISNYSNGLDVSNSGDANVGNIFQNEISDNSNTGVIIYNSHANFRWNNIHDNGTDGINLQHNSEIELYGNYSAKNVSQTQRFRDNGEFEIYTDLSSFPTLFKWNAIIDENNHIDGYELLYCDTQLSTELDVRYNYWGLPSNFVPADDLYPHLDYTYNPVFKLIDDEASSSEAETLFMTAETNFAEENYVAAQAEYQQVIEEYPTTKFANASVKHLYSVERFNNNDFNNLKQYFRSNNVILNHPELAKLADFFANKCDINLENWQTAISWFENEIQNPGSFADSLYAIIDLGNLYLLMEQSGYKSSYTGTMTEYIPVSKDQYVENRNFLLSLLPQKQNNQKPETIANLKEGELMQNVPNPFKGNTKIWYKLENESTIQLNIFNYTGQLIRTLNDGSKTKGTHFIDFNSSGLKNGIYFYSISINGMATDTKKMTILK